MMEMLLLFVLLLASLFLVIKSANFAIIHSTCLAQSFNLPNYIVGFLVVAVIAILPETFIGITSAIQGIPSFGLGTLFGANVADLSLIFALVVLVAGRNLKIESKVVKNRFLYLGIISVSVIFGLNGYYSQLEGIVLVLSGLLFYYYVLRNTKKEDGIEKTPFSAVNLLMLILSMIGLLLGAHLTVKFGVELASDLYVNPVLIGMFVVGLGTTLPELFFSIKASKDKKDGLALGDILGIVVADSTIVIGAMAIITPFSFNPRIVYITGVFMILATALVLHFMKTKRVLSKKEALFLILFYIVFVLVEFFVNTL